MAPRGKGTKRSSQCLDQDLTGKPIKKRQMARRITASSRNRGRKSKRTQNISSTTSETQRSGSSSPITSPPPSGPVEVIDLSQEFIARGTTKKGSPDFRRGDVYIEVQGHQKYSYILRSRVLAQSSPWFKTSLEQSVPEFDYDIAASVARQTGIVYRYDLDYNNEKRFWFLVRTTLTTVNEENEANETQPAPKPEFRFGLDGNSSPKLMPAKQVIISNNSPKFLTSSTDNENCGIHSGFEVGHLETLSADQNEESMKHTIVQKTDDLRNIAIVEREIGITGFKTAPNVQLDDIANTCVPKQDEEQKYNADMVLNIDSTEATAKIQKDDDVKAIQNVLDIRMTDLGHISSNEKGQNHDAIEDPLGMKRYASEDRSIKEDEEAEIVKVSLAIETDDSKVYPSIKIDKPKEFLQAEYKDVQNTPAGTNEAAAGIPWISQNAKDEHMEPSPSMENEAGEVGNISQMRYEEPKNSINVKEETSPESYYTNTGHSESYRNTQDAKIMEFVDAALTASNIDNRNTDINLDTHKQDYLDVSNINETNKDNIVIKLEDGENSPASDIINSDIITQDEAIVAFNNLFLTYYGKPPNISTTSIEEALYQTELLLDISAVYGSTPILYPSLNSALLQHGRSLYREIQRDPPRWLFISNLLQCAPVFKEAVVQIVGWHPDWPSTSVPKSQIPNKLLCLIDNKIKQLQKLKIDINELLVTSSICVDGQDVMQVKGSKEEFSPTYQVVRIWHDWLARSLTHTHSAGKKGHGARDAAIYRKIARGGDAYVSLASVVDMLKRDKVEVGGGRALSDNLEIMKQYATRVVQPLIENESMLDPEKEGIDYLTCTKVEATEFPWVV